MIVIATQCFPPRLGGIERVMQGLGDALAGAGFRVTVLADSHHDESEQEGAADRALGYPVERFGGLKLWRRRRKRRALARLLAREDVQAVFTDSWKSVETLGGGLLPPGLPVVCLAHGNEVMARDAARRQRVQKALLSATRIAANSRDTAHRVRKLGIPPDRVTVVHPGANPPPAPDAANHDAIDARLGTGRPRLVTVARLEPRKGIDQVLRSLRELVADHPDLVYAVAGGGGDKARLERLADTLGVSAHVRFLGPVSDESKGALLRSADLFVMPVRERTASRSIEGFGVAYIEAALCGLPAVAGRSGGAGDAVIDGETGILCDGTEPAAVAKAIRRALSDPECLQIMGVRARERAERDFTWAAALGRYLACAGIAPETGPPKD